MTARTRPITRGITRPLGYGVGAIAPPDLYWQSDLGVTGSPASQWTSADGAVSLAQAVAGSRPAVTANAFNATQGLTFDGVDDILTFTGRPITNTGPGSLSIVFKTPAVISAGVIVSESNSAAANDWWEVGIAASGRWYVESNNAGTKHTVEGTTFLEASTVYNLILTFDGTDFYALIAGVEENPLSITNAGAFAWIGRVSAGTPVFAVGGTVVSGLTARPLSFVLGGLYFWNRDIT